MVDIGTTGLFANDVGKRFREMDQQIRADRAALARQQRPWRIAGALVALVALVTGVSIVTVLLWGVSMWLGIAFLILFSIPLSVGAIQGLIQVLDS